MSEFWAQAAELVWGPATVVLLVGTGIYLSFRLKFTHLRQFRLGWRFAAQGIAVPERTQAEASALLGAISPWQSKFGFCPHDDQGFLSRIKPSKNF